MAGALQTRWYFLTVALGIYTASGTTYRVVPGAVLAAAPRGLLGMPVLIGLNQKLRQSVFKQVLQGILRGPKV